MNSLHKKTYRRILMYGVFILFLIFCIGILSQIIAYFNTGADQYLNTLTKKAINTHTPSIEWSYASYFDPMSLDEALKEAIEEAYIQAWYVLNKSIETNNSIAMLDYYSSTIKNNLDTMLMEQQNWDVQRVDLSHNLEVNLVSLDRQLVAFTDRGVEIKKIIKSKNSDQLIANTLEKADYDVVMTLNDGSWRVKNIHKSSSVNIPHIPHEAVGYDSTYYTCIDGKFYKEGREFNVKGINYYPAYSPWIKFWNNFNVDTIRRDFEIIRDFNFNTLRIFIPFGIFGKGDISNQKLSRLDQLIAMAEEFNLALIITLFDFPEGFDIQEYPGTDRHLETILTRYAGSKNILAWDIKNEPDRDFEIHGKDKVTNWLEFTIQRAREYAPRQLITIGWSKSQYASLLNESLDFVSFHFYEKPSQLGLVLDQLKAELPGKTIMLQETGMPSSSYYIFPGGGSESDQYAYLEEVLNILKNNDEMPYCIWTLYDFSEAPSEVFGWKPWIKHLQKNFGILKSDGSPKQASRLFNNIN